MQPFMGECAVSLRLGPSSSVQSFITRLRVEMAIAGEAHKGMPGFSHVNAPSYKLGEMDPGNGPTKFALIGLAK